MSNVYQKNYLNETVTLRDGKDYTFFKVITALKEDGVELTLQSSIVTVEADPGSWWQDTATGLLYIHCSDGLSPDAHNIIAKFCFYCASENIIFNNRFYEGRIADISSISNSTGILPEMIETEGGDISLNNADGFFDTLSEKFIWEKSELSIKYGSDLMAYTDFMQFLGWKIENKGWEENNFKINFFSVKKELEKKIISDKFDLTTYPNLEANALDTYIPISYGTPFTSLDETPLLVCINTKKNGGVTETGTSIASSDTTNLYITGTLLNTTENYYKGHQVEWNGLISKITASSYVVETDTHYITMEEMADFATDKVFVLRKYNQQEFYIPASALSTVYIDYGDGLGWLKIVPTTALATNTFTLTTHSDGALSGFQEGTTRVKALFTPSVITDGNISDAVKYLCKLNTGLNDDNLDSPSFVQSAIDAEGVIHDYISDQITVKAAIERVVKSVMCRFYTALNGKIKFIIWSPRRTSGYDEYQDYEYLSFSVNPIDEISNKISIGYNKNYEKNEYHYTTITDTESIWEYEEREIKTIDTLLVNKSDAIVLGQRIQFIINQPGRIVSFETALRGLQKADTGDGDIENNIGSKLYTTKTKSPNSIAGGMNAVQCEVLGIDRNLKDGIIGISCIDILGLGLGVGIWVSDDVKNYDDPTITEGEKNISGFWTDDFGKVGGVEVDSYWW